MSAIRRLAILAVVVGGLAAAATAVAGGVLAFEYRPGSATTDRWRDVHKLGTAVFLVAAAAGVVLGLVLLAGPKRVLRPSPAFVALSAVALGMAGLTLATRDRVEFENVALAPVTVGAERSGYKLGFDDDVRFVIVDGKEVEQEEYVAALLAHLGAPAAGAAALWIAVALASRPPDRSRDVE